MFSKNIKSYKGVTFMELMVVIAIISIMSAIGFSLWQSTKGESYLRDAQREVASAIKTAQSYALQGRLRGGEVPCEYGVSINHPNIYRIIYRQACGGSIDTLEEFTLKNGTTFDNQNGHYMLFNIPFANVTTATWTTSLIGQLDLRHGGKIKTITIDSNGNVAEN